MTKYIYVLAEDLQKDAEAWANDKGYKLISKFGRKPNVGIKPLSILEDGDVLYLHSHGGYYGYEPDEENGHAKSRGDIFYRGGYCSARSVGILLKSDGLENKEIDLRVFACFTAGTVAEKIKPIDTFAGKLCATLRVNYDKIHVFGYVGQTKAGTKPTKMAGIPVPPRREVLSQRTLAWKRGVDPMDWQYRARNHRFQAEWDEDNRMVRWL